ncbi:MAG: DNA polymerase III subunit epsilon [Pseudomonadales bacterium]
MRQIVLDTETTGLEPNMGHRIIEIGAVEIVDRKLTGRHYHEYVNPERDSDDGALEVHGITTEFLADKPLFAEVAKPFLSFIEGAELIIHNAAFDVSFLDYELNLVPGNIPKIADVCQITDSLALARRKHPGQKNNLDALCRRYMVDNSQRELHGALLDAEILADVYLLMTGGQTALFGQSEQSKDEENATAGHFSLSELNLKPVLASLDEVAAHERYLQNLEATA